MSIRLKGQTGLRVVATERVFDEQTGFQTIVTYEGLRESVDSAMGVLSLFPGLRMGSRRQNGPWYSFTVNYAGTEDGAQEGALDKWSRVTEFAQEDIRSNPSVLAAVEDEAGTPQLAADLLNAWHSEIKAAIRAGDPLSEHIEGPDINPIQQKLYELYVRGAEAHEVRRIVIRRRRIIPIEFATPTVPQPVEPIYTRAKLISTFGIPANAQVLIPADPNFDPPSNTAWAWKERANESDFVPSINKVEEMVEFAQAAWSTFLYKLQA